MTILFTNNLPAFYFSQDDSRERLGVEPSFPNFSGTPILKTVTPTGDAFIPMFLFLNDNIVKFLFTLQLLTNFSSLVMGHKRASPNRK